MKIPQKHIDFCRDIATIARAHGVEKFHLQFTPGFGDEWPDEISLHWVSGRHGDSGANIHVTSTIDVYTKLDEKKL